MAPAHVDGVPIPIFSTNPQPLPSPPFKPLMYPEATPTRDVVVSEYWGSGDSGPISNVDYRTIRVCTSYRWVLGLGSWFMVCWPKGHACRMKALK